MIRLLIGHRGTGKSSFLARVIRYFGEDGKKLRSYDLDQYIADREDKTIGQIFVERGEEHFRSLEQKYLRELVDNNQDYSGEVFISLGGGITLNDDVLALCDVWWIRRDSDSTGRIFLDRPRLDEDVTPLQEYDERYRERSERFKRYCDRIVVVTEGFNYPNQAEKELIFNKINDLGGELTLFTEDVTEKFVKDREGWGIRSYELRDDLLSEDDIGKAYTFLEREKVLVSLRKGDFNSTVEKLITEGCRWDFPLELVEQWERVKDWGNPTIISLHERKGDESFEELLDRFDPWRGKAILKFAPLVEDFEELIIGHQWAMKDPKNRAFLPRSYDGRWSWYRLLHSRIYPVNFFRESDGSSQDQPQLMDWIRFPKEDVSSFAAIIGHPVGHSYTPAEHFGFFRERNVPILRINVEFDQWEEGMKSLAEMGLRFAAVTSPLKLKAYELCDIKTDQAELFQSVNTLFRTGNQRWIGHNTDLEGLNTLLEDIMKKEKIVVWGGGGTLPLLERIIPQAQFASVRTGKGRDGSELISDPDIIVWAVGAMRDLRMPPYKWRPEELFDLNYFDHSPGIEYALRVGAIYRSGLKMFLAQAAGQRKFWKQYEW